MSDPLEEAEALELGNWNSSEYDMAIGEEEEERLLEEDDITERTQAFPYEGEAEVEPTFSDTEFDTEEADEEDVLDLGLNEELPEYDESVADSQDTDKKPSADQSQNKSLATAEKSTGSLFSPKAESSPRQDAIRKTETNRVFSRGGYQRNFNNNNRPPHMQNSFQMRGGPGPRLRHPGFVNQRPQFDGPRPQMGRPPSILDYRPPHGSFVRNPLPLGKPFLSQDYHHGPPVQRMQQRYGFEEQQQQQHQFPSTADVDRNNPGNRYFINPHYRGSVTVRGDGTFTSHARFPNGDHGGSNFPPPGKLMSPELLSRPPPPILNPLRERPVGLPLRFPPPVNQPAIPQQVVRFSGLTGQLVNKPPAPKNLMDVVLTTPSSFHGRSHPFSLQQLQQPPRFHHPQHLINAGDPRFLGPPPMTSGIKRHAASELVSGAPLKQLRIGPTGNIQISRTFATASAPASATQVTSGNSALRIGASPSRPTQPSPATTTVSPTVSSSSVPETKTSPSPVKAPGPSMENLSAEEKEYFLKIEEQRKKREEVLRLKEERRRQKLAAQGGNSEFSSMEITPPPVSKNDAFISPPMMGRAQGVVSASPNTSYSQVMPQSHAQPAIATENGAPIQQRKTQLVKPIMPTGMNPTLVYPSTNHVSPQPGRRYKIIIVKNKSGKILEKRRVPIDESYRPMSNEAPSLNSAEQSGAGLSVAGIRPLTTRISETVTIENLDSKSTEDDVRNLCQNFGPVQEIYPKLHEGKAIVRFESAVAAKSFVSNHNTPGICVRYL